MPIETMGRCAGVGWEAVMVVVEVACGLAIVLLATGVLFCLFSE